MYEVLTDPDLRNEVVEALTPVTFTASCSMKSGKLSITASIINECDFPITGKITLAAPKGWKAVNTKLGLMIGYCFRRSDYPWVAIWHENCSRSDAPWSGRTQTLGLEFGASPFPIVRRDAFEVGPLWGTPTHTCVPAGGKKNIRYVAFLAQVPQGFGGVRDIKLDANEIIVHGSGTKEVVRVKASGLAGTGLLG